MALGRQVLTTEGSPIRAKFGIRAGSMLESVQPFGLDGASDLVWGLAAFNAKNWLATLNSGTYAVAGNGTTGLLEGTLTTNAVAQALAQLQESMDGGTTAVIRFLPKAGLIHMAELSLKVSEVTTSGLMFGFASIDTTLMAAGASDVADLIGFYKATAAATVVGRVMNATTATDTATLATLSNNTYVKLGIKVEGVTSVGFYVNGIRTGQTTMTNIPTAALAMSLAYSANAKTCIFKDFWYATSGAN